MNEFVLSETPATMVIECKKYDGIVFVAEYDKKTGYVNVASRKAFEDFIKTNTRAI